MHLALTNNRLSNKDRLITRAVAHNRRRWQGTNRNPLPSQGFRNCTLRLSTQSRFSTAQRISKCLRATLAGLGIFLFEQPAHRHVRVSGGCNNRIYLTSHLRPRAARLTHHLVDLSFRHALRTGLPDPHRFQLCFGELAPSRW